MIPNERFEQVEIASLSELRTWLQSNWGRVEGVWLVRFKKNVPAKFVDRLDVLDELLCFGWVDGIARKLDDERTMQLIFPRKQQAWADSYRKRVEILENVGRMAEAGRAAIARSKTSGQWNAYALVDALVVPTDLRQALAQSEVAERFFDQSARSYRRNVLRWITQAKKPETRAKRIDTTVAFSRARKKMPQM